MADNFFSFGDLNQPLLALLLAGLYGQDTMGLASRGMKPPQVIMCVCTHAHVHSCDLPEGVYLCGDTCETCLAHVWCCGVLVSTVLGMSVCRANLSGFKCSHQGMSG